jgi:hypothetical protein
MKKVALLLIVVFPLVTAAQNVGIGTSTPSARLEVKKNDFSSLKISSDFYNDTTELLLSNRDNFNQGTDFSIRSVEEQGLFFSSSSDLPANNSSNSLVIRPGGNVGVGILPLTRFHVNGSSRFTGQIQLEGLSLFEFGYGVAGKELNAGKIGYNAFGQNALTIISAGTNINNRAVYFFAEGGTTFTGALNFFGPLQTNGNSGTTGQVLQSNGTAAPVWRNAALDNNTRFSVLFSTTTEGIGNINVESTQYNLAPADITVGTSTLTINKTGLYHINAQLTSRVLTTLPTSYVPEMSSNITFSSGATVVNFFSVANLDHYQESISNAGAEGSYYFSRRVDGYIYLTAGMTVRVNRDLRVEGTPIDVIFDVSVIGHLVDE